METEGGRGGADCNSEAVATELGGWLRDVDVETESGIVDGVVGGGITILGVWLRDTVAAPGWSAVRNWGASSEVEGC